MTVVCQDGISQLANGDVLGSWVRADNLASGSIGIGIIADASGTEVPYICWGRVILVGNC